MTTHHVGLSVRGALGWPKRRIAKLFVHDDGRYLTADEAREALLDALAAGNEMLPVGDACDDFDPKTGCRGHRRRVAASSSVSASTSTEIPTSGGADAR